MRFVIRFWKISLKGAVCQYCLHGKAVQVYSTTTYFMMCVLIDLVGKVASFLL